MDKKTGIQVFHALLAKLRLMDQKAAILSGYGVGSTKDLSEVDLATICARLRDMEAGKYKPSAAQRTWRSNVLTMLNKLGIYATNNDWSAVNNYLMSNKIAGKLLYEMDVDELKTLYKKLQSILAKKEDKDKELARLKNCN